ncbi:hypothetical protein [Pseudomonas flexibilis]|uniref:hypothetical protein n=1 Tax=Pseudomonas flexibilis TaxID=706570 RepID=UPI0011134594|nr:hypothetical protein [Pseudomonas flexibilis]
MNKIYPRRRVVIFFSLSPCLVSLSLGLALGLKAIALGVSDPKAWLFVFIVAFLGSMLALFLYGVPAFILGCLCCLLRLHRTLPSLILISFLGGFAAYAGEWVAVNFYGDRTPLSVFLEPWIIWLLGGGASLMAGSFALPGRKRGLSEKGG